MKMKIRTKEDKVLRQKNIKIKNPADKDIQSLISSMLETMRVENGVGLAAPQIGKNLRLCVIEEGGVTYVLINPKVTASSKKKVFMEEGCLSFPGEFFDISRPEEVKVRYIDEAGANKKVKANGLLGRALQHEIDHLDGILVIDRLKKSKKTKKVSIETKI
jgi:peptide deformylase